MRPRHKAAENTAKTTAAVIVGARFNEAAA